MSTAVAARARRNVDLVAVLSAAFHAGLIALGLVLADQSGSQNYLLLSAFSALGLIATLLGRASVTAGSGAWTSGVVALALSIGVLGVALTGEGGLGILAIAIPMLFLDWLLFSNARRAVS